MKEVKNYLEIFYRQPFFVCVEINQTNLSVIFVVDIPSRVSTSCLVSHHNTTSRQISPCVTLIFLQRHVRRAPV